MDDLLYMKGSHNILNFFRTARHVRKFYRENPLYFEPCGIWVFCGSQGSGKTLSAVKAVRSLVQHWPNAVVCTNIPIVGIDTIPFTDYSQITDLTNGIEGVIFLIDEIHVVWNSLESKNIDFSQMAAFAQMRKDRRVIIGTSQVYGRMAKPIREQLRYVVLCRNFWNFIQVNTVLDPNGGEYSKLKDSDTSLSEGQKLAVEWFFHSVEDYTCYDTLTKIEKPKKLLKG